METITTWGQLEARFAEVLRDVNIIELPFPSNGRCECGSSSFSVLELGYTRDTDLGLEFDDHQDDDEDDEDVPPGWSSINPPPSQFGPDVRDRTITAAWVTTGGWSDFSDEGLYEVIVCCRCQRLYDVATLDINWE